MNFIEFKIAVLYIHTLWYFILNKKFFLKRNFKNSSRRVKKKHKSHFKKFTYGNQKRELNFLKSQYLKQKLILSKS